MEFSREEKIIILKERIEKEKRYRDSFSKLNEKDGCLEQYIKDANLEIQKCELLLHKIQKGETK